MTKVAAVDIGATSGRVMIAELGDAGIAVTEAARFANRPCRRDDRWVWDIDGLFASMVAGLHVAASQDVASWGIDTWAVDYGVVAGGSLVGPVRCYRDPWHANGIARVEDAIAWDALYSITGTQHMPINTVYQIAADEPQRLVDGTTLLLVPDLLSFRATGALGSDVTNASTTGLVDVRTRQWSAPVLAALGLPASAFLPLDEPGVVRGETRVTGLSGLPLIGVATHDTASAFAGTPIGTRDSALVLSLGTWALIGAEVAQASPTEAARTVNATHELGIDGTVRVLRNVSGMWLFEECRRVWGIADGMEPDIPRLLAAAEREPAFAAIFDVDDPGLASPGQSAHTIGPHLIGTWSGTRGSVVRVILESLVVRLAQRARQIERLLGGERDTLHVVGGASRMAHLMQWLADATGKRVVAGPVEASAIGNAVVQWRTLGAVGSLAEARARIAVMPEIRTYVPTVDRSVWDAYAARLEG